MKILCVGNRNTCRSPMFEVLLRQEMALRGRSDVAVESAGIMRECVGQPANPKSVECMRRHGLDLRPHHSRHVMSLPDFQTFKFIFCMEPVVVQAVNELKPRGIILLANENESGIPNPFGESQEVYEECAVLIERVVREVANAL